MPLPTKLSSLGVENFLVSLSLRVAIESRLKSLLLLKMVVRHVRRHFASVTIHLKARKFWPVRKRFNIS